jgi:uncharacterized protein (TIGR00255 family)
VAINSMTGFAREAGTTGSFQWVWEVKTVNGRGLDVRLRVPPGFDAVGEDVRGQLQKALARGSCQVTLTLSRTAGAATVKVNENALASLTEALARLKLPDGVRPPSVDGLLAVRGVVEVEDETDDEAARDDLGRDLRAAVGRLIDAVREARQAEGRALAEVIEGHLAAMERLVEAAETAPARQPEAIRARLQEQIAALLDAGGGALDPARLHQEAVLLAARADIREEIDRLRAHIAAARDLLRAGGPVGRRLDFLAQEFGREANTLCSKAGDVSVSRIGLDLKATVEQFREQIQNVE